jgi:hypothetical protein
MTRPMATFRQPIFGISLIPGILSAVARGREDQLRWRNYAELPGSPGVGSGGTLVNRLACDQACQRA